MLRPSADLAAPGTALGTRKDQELPLQHDPKNGQPL